MILIMIPFFCYFFFEVLADVSNGSRMIWITRMMCNPPDLKPRSDLRPLRLRVYDESWTLFTHAFEVSMPSELQDLKEKIIRRCGGLPLLIVKLAESLSQKDTTMEDWPAAFQQFCYHQEKV